MDTWTLECNPIHEPGFTEYLEIILEYPKDILIYFQDIPEGIYILKIFKFVEIRTIVSNKIDVSVEESDFENEIYVK